MHFTRDELEPLRCPTMQPGVAAGKLALECPQLTFVT